MPRSEQEVASLTVQPVDPVPGPDTGPYEVIHLGGQAAVVVPVVNFLRLRALELHASAEELAEAQDAAALADWTSRQCGARRNLQWDAREKLQWARRKLQWA